MNIDKKHLTQLLLNNPTQHNDSDWIIDYNRPLYGSKIHGGIFKATKINQMIDEQVLSSQDECVVKLIKNIQFGLDEYTVLLNIKRMSDPFIKVYGYSLGKSLETTTSRDLYLYMQYKEDYSNLLDYLRSRVNGSEMIINNLFSIPFYSQPSPTNELLQNIQPSSNDKQLLKSLQDNKHLMSSTQDSKLPSTEPLHIDSEWEIENSPLGKGGRSVGVFRCRKIDCTINGKLIPNNGNCAVKIVDEAGEHELAILRKLISSDHNNIIKIYGYSFGKQNQQPTSTSSRFYIYMEYNENYIDLLEYIKRKVSLGEEEIKKITLQLVNTLEYLNETHRIIHRDIKSSNIMYDPHSGIIKLIDFGVSKQWVEKSISSSIVGTMAYWAPEVKDGNFSSSRSDIWSVGCTILQLAGGNIFTKNERGVPTILPHLSNQFKHFIQNCFIIDPLERPKANELKYHIFLNGANQIKEPVSYVDLNFDNILKSTADITLYIQNTISASTTRIKVRGFIYNNDSTVALFNNIPPTITHLILEDFNQDSALLRSLPTTIKSLSLPAFNQEANSIPETIIELVLGEEFDLKEKGGNLPDTIKRFRCSYNFQSPLQKRNNIPQEAAVVVLSNYNHPITRGSIPSTAHTLILGSNFQHFDSFENIPPSVFNLKFGVSNDCELDDNQIKKFISPSITKIIINRNK